MSHKRLLLLSNSKNYGERYLEHAENTIKDFLGPQVREVLFVPFASVRASFDDFTGMVRGRFREMGYELASVHESDDPQGSVARAEAIVIGGGNTFHLLHGLYKSNLLEAVRERAGG